MRTKVNQPLGRALLVVGIAITMAYWYSGSQWSADPSQEIEHRSQESGNVPVRPQSVMASGSAIDTEAKAEDAAIAEIPAGINPVNPVARLVTSVEVGQWLGSCLAWQDERPHWIVGVETDSVPDWFGTGNTGTSIFDFAGVFIVLDANEGEMVAFGAIDQDEYDEIANLSSQALTVTYETPMPPDAGVATDQAGPNPTQALATAIAVPTAEAACRASNW